MSKINKLIYYLISISFFILFDMYFSNIIIHNIELIPNNPLLDLIYVENTGAAFSILQDSRIFLACFSLLALLWILFYSIKKIQKASLFSLLWVSILISGIFCNAFERIVYGYVRDYFKLNFVNFPVFNISDIFINISVLAIVVIIIKHNYSKNDETNN